MDDPTSLQIKLTRKYLKLKILEDTVTFRGHNLERSHVYDLMKKTITQGESHSALIIGPRGAGKTTLINSVLHQLSKELDTEYNTKVVQLNGLVHNEEKVAIKAITAQLQMEDPAPERLTSSAAHIAYLRTCLRTVSSSDDRCSEKGVSSGGVILILDECEQLAGSSQTLLYNLFDMTHEGTSPLCVVGLTSRLDFMDLLEKRVRSRFSHRHIFLLPNEITDANYETTLRSPLDTYRTLFKELLTLPEFNKKNKKGRSKSTVTVEREVDFSVFTRCNLDRKHFDDFDPSFVSDWNCHVTSVAENEKTIDALEKLCYYTVNEQIFRDVLFQIVCRLSPRKRYIDSRDVSSVIDNTVSGEQRLQLLQSLSVLELSLVIAMKHGMAIFDGQPMNFEMMLHRYTKFANANSSAQTVPRAVILKAFEHLQALQLVTPVRSTDGIYANNDSISRVQKEFQLFALAAPIADVDEAVKRYKALPTEIQQWCYNSID